MLDNLCPKTGTTQPPPGSDLLVSETLHSGLGGNDGGCNCLIVLLPFLPELLVLAALAFSQNLFLYRPLCRIQLRQSPWVRLTNIQAVPGI